MSTGGKLWAIRVKEPGMKVGVLLSSDGTLVNRLVHAAAMPREKADRIAAQIRAEGRRGDSGSLRPEATAEARAVRRPRGGGAAAAMTLLRKLARGRH